MAAFRDIGAWTPLFTDQEDRSRAYVAVIGDTVAPALPGGASR